MVSVVRETMELGDKDGLTRQAFDDFETIIISVSSFRCSVIFKTTGTNAFRLSVGQETPLVGTHVTDLVNFFLLGAENKSYVTEVRVMSLNALLWVIRLRVCLPSHRRVFIFADSHLFSPLSPPSSSHHKIIELLTLADSIVARLLPIGREDTSDSDEDTPAGVSGTRLVSPLLFLLPADPLTSPISF